MSSNRLSWIGVGVVVLVVGAFVVRTLRQDATVQDGTPQVESAPAASPDVASNTGGAASGTQTGTGGTRERLPSSIQRAKVLLKAKGFYGGEINGDLDPATVEAVKKFQTSVGMRPTGYLDKPTYKALGIEMEGRRK